LDITIIIPTYERPEKILRALDYWKQYPVEVIIMDGSPKRSILNTTLIKYPNVVYHHVVSSFEERLMQGASNVKTPYGMFLSDDEFLIYPALVEACEALKSEHELSAVLGSSVQFSVFRGQMVGAICYSSSQLLKIDGESPLSRLEQRHKCPGNIIFYSLTRANILKLAAEFISEKKYSCQYISEYQMEAVLCSAGKVRVLNRLMWLRSLETPPVSFKGWRRSVHFDQWCMDNKNIAELSHLKKSADKFLSMAGVGDKKIPGKIFIDKYSKYEEDINKPERTLKNKIKIHLRQFFELLPSKLKFHIRNLKTSLTKNTLMQIDQVLIELKYHGVRTDVVDIMRIKSLVERTKE